jgi:hypothetical protein
MFCWSLWSTAQDRTHAREQFRKRERFDQVIVCAQLESFHTVSHTVASRKKKNRRANPIAPEFRDHFPAVLMWQHDIDDKKIKFARTRMLQADFAIERKVDCKTGFAQSLGQESRSFLFVFDNENPHCRKSDLFRAANLYCCCEEGAAITKPASRNVMAAENKQ